MRGTRRWADPHARTSLTAGPSFSREADDEDPHYEPPRIRLGFTPPRRDVDEPLTWEGDQA